jgi:hypothetical protein
VDSFPQRIGDSPRIFSQLPPSPWQVIQEHVKQLQDAQHQSLGQVKHLEGCCSAVILWGFHGDFNGVFGAMKIELRKNGGNDYRRKQIEAD